MRRGMSKSGYFYREKRSAQQRERDRDNVDHSQSYREIYKGKTRGWERKQYQFVIVICFLNGELM